MSDDEPRDYEDPLGVHSGDYSGERRVEIVNVWPNSDDGVMRVQIRNRPSQDRTLWLVRVCRSTQAYKAFRESGFFDRDLEGAIPVLVKIEGSFVSRIRVLIDEDFPEKGALLAVMVMRS